MRRVRCWVGILLTLALVIAPARAKTTALAGQRADVLTENVKTFEMRVRPNLVQMGKPFYSLTVRVSGNDAESVMRTPKGDPFDQRFPLLESQAGHFIERNLPRPLALPYLERAAKKHPDNASRRRAGWLLANPRVDR